jgi:hypothetical protein
MALFLQIIGFLFLLFIVLVVGVILVIRWKLKQFVKGLEGLTTDAMSTPSRIHLVPESNLVWKDPTGARQLQDDFRTLGFTDTGSYTVPELSALRLHALSKAEDSAYAVVYEHDAAGVWIDIVTRYEDGTSVTYSTARQGGELDQRPGHSCTRDPEASPSALYQRFLAERPQRAMETVGPDEFVQKFEQAYADSMDWRNARGGPTEEEIRAIAAASGEEYTEEMVQAIKEQKRAEAMEGLREAIQERFLKESTLSAGEWEEVRDRLIFVHDKLTQAEAGELFDQWVGDREVVASRPQEAVGTTAREFFSALVELAPASREFRKLGTVSDPLEADIYAGPPYVYTDDDDDEDEDDD